MQSSSAISAIAPAIQPSALARRAEREPVALQKPGAAEEPAAAEKTGAGKESQRPAELPPAELKEIEQLKRRDREVKAHEMAHKAAAGQFARGAASFDYKTGPDGKRYAVGGEVSIDISREADPQKTLEKAMVIRRAALAPADPSGQDRRIASQATTMMAEARKELLIERRETAVAEKPAEGEPAGEEQPSISPTGRRALNLFKAVETASMPARENPFDHFI